MAANLSGLENVALLVIDVQVGMDAPDRPPRNNPDAEEHIARLLSAFRTVGQPCIHVRHDDLDPDSPFAPGKPGHPIKDEVAPEPGETLIIKHVNSAFIGTDLEERLRAKGIETLVVTGLAANYCVESTARTAGNLGFRTLVVQDATAAWDHVDLNGRHIPADDVLALTLATLHDDFASIVTTAEVLEALATVPSSRA